MSGQEAGTMKSLPQGSAVPLAETRSLTSESWRFDWRMKHELAFLRRLGSWRRRENVADRGQLLRGYLEGLALRRQWVNLQREPLECEARLLLKQMEEAV